MFLLLILLFVTNSYAADKYEKVSADTIKITSTVETVVNVKDLNDERVYWQGRLDNIDKQYAEDRANIEKELGLLDSKLSVASDKPVIVSDSPSDIGAAVINWDDGL